MSQAESPEEESPLPPEVEAELLAALEAALRPTALAPRLNERLIEMALEEPLAPPSEEELIESARLRDALADGALHDDASVLAALRVAFDAERHVTDAAVGRALDAALETKEPVKAPRSNVVYRVFGAASVVVAAAAAVALFTGISRNDSAPASSAQPSALFKPRSTAPLFDDRFETAETTARMDLIASARTRDLRDNRYAAWGVR